RSRLFACCPLWYYPGFEEAPQRNESLTGYRDNADTPHAFASAPKALAKPTTQGTLRLIPEPPPRQLCGHPAHVPVPRLGDALFPGTRAAVIRRWRSACSTASFPPRLQRAPAKKFHHYQPCPIAPDASALPHLPHLLDAGFLRALPQRTTLGFQRRHLLTQQLVRRIHPQETTAQTTRKRRAIP